MIEELKHKIKTKEHEVTEADEKLQSAKAVTAKAQLDVNFFLDVRRYDTNFMADILTLVKPKSTITRENTGASSRRGSEKRAPARAR